MVTAREERPPNHRPNRQRKQQQRGEVKGSDLHIRHAHAERAARLLQQPQQRGALRVGRGEERSGMLMLRAVWFLGSQPMVMQPAGRQGCQSWVTFV